MSVAMAKGRTRTATWDGTSSGLESLVAELDPPGDMMLGMTAMFLGGNCAEIRIGEAPPIYMGRSSSLTVPDPSDLRNWTLT